MHFNKDSMSQKSINIVELEESDDLVKEVLVLEYTERKRTKWQTVKKYPYAVYCISTMVFALILTSFESQAGGIVISISKFREDFGEQLPDGTYAIEAKWQSAFLGVPLVAQMVGQNLASFLADRVGKKWVIFGAIAVGAGLVGFQFSSTTVQTFLASKTLIAICLGTLQVSAAGYVADVTPLPLRGFATTLCNISYSIGPLVCFIINYSQANNTTKWAYRSMFASQWGLAAVALVLVLFVPESPVYHIIKEQPEKAENCYKKLLGSEDDAKKQVLVVQTTIKEAEAVQQGYTYLDCFKGINRKRTLVAAVPFLFQPFSGVAFTINYTAYWFQLAGFSESKSFKFTIGAQVQSVAGCIAALFVVDRIGRRTTILWGVAALNMVNFIIGGTGLDKLKNSLNTTIAFMMMYGFWYNLGLGCVCYPIAMENPTSALRTKTFAISMTCNLLGNMLWLFIIPYIFNPDEGNLGSSTMFIFAGCGILFWIFFYFYVPETAGRSLDEIDEMYFSRVSQRKFKIYKTKVEMVGEETFVPDNKPLLDHVEKV